MIEYMKEWLRYTTEMRKNKVKYKDKPIWKYFISKNKVITKQKKQKQKSNKKRK